MKDDNEELETEDKQSQEDRESEAFQNFRHDYKMAKEAKTTIDKLIVEWNDLYYGKKSGNENPQKSQIVMREIAKQIEFQKQALMEPFTSPSHPIRIKSGKDANRSRIMQKYLTAEFTGEFDRQEFMDTLTDVMLREGTAWIRTGWKYTEEKKINVKPNVTMEELLQEEVEPEDIKQNKDGTFRVKYESIDVIENCPTLEVCRNEHIFPDPSARTMDECRFIIYKKYVTISELRQAGIYDEEKIEELEGKLNAESREDTGLGSVRDADQRDYGYDSTYQPKDTNRQKISIIEYWGYYDLDGTKIAKPIVATWAEKEKTDLYIGENPYPSKNIPFNRCVYSARPFSLWGNALAYFVGDNQKVTSGIMRGILDNMSLANNGQKFVQRGALDYVNFKRLRNGEKHIIVNKPDSIADGSYNNLPPSLFTTMETVKQDTRELTGNTGGGSQSPALKSVDEDNPQQMTMAQQRIAGTVRNLSNVIGKALKEWLTMAEVFLTNEQIYSLFSEKDAQDVLSFEEAKFTQISVKVGTEATRMARIHQINMLMQQSKVLGEQTPPDTVTELTAEMFELLDKYDQAENIRAYEPPPNPMAEMMQKLEIEKAQLENEKLKAEIDNLRAGAVLDQSDAMTRQADAQAGMEYKKAQTAEKYAKAQSHEVETALKPVHAMNEAEKSRQKKQ